MNGLFKANGSPTFEIEVYGYSETNKQKFIAIFDTGYTGFLAIPFTLAAPLGLILIGTESYTIADGSRKTDLTCMGTVVLGDAEKTEFIDVSFAGGSILLGMRFLRETGLTLFIDPKNGEVKIEQSPIISSPILLKPATKKKIKKQDKPQTTA